MRLYALIKSSSSEHHDWEAVLLTYAPAYRIQEYAVLHGHRKPESHQQRLRYVSRELRRLYPDFHWLYLLDKKARYNPEFVVTREMRDLAEGKCMRILGALA